MGPAERTSFPLRVLVFISHALGGYVIADGPGLGALPWVVALAPLAALALALCAIRFDRARADVRAAAEWGSFGLRRSSGQTGRVNAPRIVRSETTLRRAVSH
jgi:hypothetical protein